MATPEARRVSQGTSIDYTPGSDVAAGEVIVIGNRCFVAPVPISSGVPGALDAVGIFDVAKQDTVEFTAGDAVYWVAAQNYANKTTTGTWMGIAVQDAGASDASVRVLLLSMQEAAAEALGLADLSDIDGAMDYTAGNLLVGDGDSMEPVAVSGDATLAADGTLSLNAAHEEQEMIIPVEDLDADGDIAARPIFVHPRACTLASIGILTQGAPADVDDANTVVIALKDDAGNTIVTKTYNTGTQPPSSDYEDLGALDGTHKALTAGEHVTLTVTQGTTADMPAFAIILRFVPTNA